MKSAIIYYSRSGNTAKIANKIKNRFDSDMYFVRPEKDYGNYASALFRVEKEAITKKATSFANNVADFSSYDIIFLGFPIWAGCMPGFEQDYVKACGIDGKIVVPFATAGTNGEQRALANVKDLLPNADVKNYFYTNLIKRRSVEDWIDGLSF